MAILALAAFAAAGVVLSRVDYVPIWDGRVYAACISAAAERFEAEALRCAGHASQAFAALAAVVQMLAPTSEVPLMATNATLFALACVGFHRLFRTAFPVLPPLDRALFTAAFTVHPAFLSGVVQPGLDLPLLPGFLWSVVFALERRWVSLVVTGLALAFTKETGVLLYAVLLACYAVWFELRTDGSVAVRVKRMLRLAPLTLPGLVFVGYLIYRRLVFPGQPALWLTGTTNDSLLKQFLVPRLDLYQVNYAVLIFVLSFGWVIAAVIAADAFIGTVRAAHREPPRALPGVDRRVYGFLVLLTVVAGYALTRFTTFGHTRYFLVLYALLFPPFAGALLRLSLPVVVRRVLLGTYAGLLLLSNLRTADPVSRRLYGTFAFGSHDLLRMTRITGECCGFGQDQLAYNVQFTAVQRLIDDALASTIPNGPAIIVVPDSTSWIFADPPAGRRRRFMYHGRTGPKPVVVEHKRVVAASRRPDSAYYLALPYGDNARAMRELSPFFDFRGAQQFEANGYALSVFRLVARAAPPP